MYNANSNVSLMVENVTWIKRGITINTGVSAKPPKKHHVYEKDYYWNTFENGRYAWSIIDDSVITCDEIIETTKTVSTKNTSNKTIPTDFKKKKSNL